ncbi:MAG: two-component sensor histidine kinase [Rickettsiaceae bacterium]|jgi:two-component system sensor histidine kinase PhcS|nr:two-component sensor histidine kinase [Rickettsiaceae bacterium]
MEEFQQTYIEADKNLRVKRSIIGCILSIILVPAGFSLDWFLYPDFMMEFLTLRLACSLITIFVLALHYTEFGKNHIKYLSFIWLTLIPIIICTMIFMTDRHLSTYYAGLNLVILATAVVLPFTIMEMTIFCAITIFCYLIAAVHFPLTQGDILYNNLYFLVLTSIISITSSYFNSQYRFHEFRLNHELKKTINTLKTTRDKLIQSEKINAIGTLSAGLLHEVNNPLNYTISALYLMKTDSYVSTNEELKDIVKDMEDGMTRIKNIVSDLRAFAYPERADVKNRFSVYDVVQNTLRFTASEYQGVERIIDIPKDLMADGSQTHIVQVLINLIFNAGKAIIKSGTKKGIIRIDARKENNRVIISVSDNGIGMSEEIRQKVFDPFFTTNDVGEGMGLGLSVSHTIIKNHGGNLMVESKLGEGSKFYFDLPCG